MEIRINKRWVIYSKDDAEKAAEYCKAMIEAQEKK